jgi:hypothetical protein
MAKEQPKTEPQNKQEKTAEKAPVKDAISRLKSISKGQQDNKKAK